MDELLQGADAIKSVYSNFFDGLKSFSSDFESETTVNSLVDGYLDDLESITLPKSVEDAVWLGE